jgi:Zn finger protein HypA/HybF involved in hydrogenase expression
VEFARSILKYAQNNHKRKLLRRVKAIEPGIGQIKITEKEYVDFHF